LDLLLEMLSFVWKTLTGNGFYLALGVLVAAFIKVYTDPEKIRHSLLQRPRVSLFGAVAFGAFTPF